MTMKNVEYYTEDIAERLAGLVSESFPATKENIIADLDETLFMLKTIADNDRNADHYRTTYLVLENICYQIDCGSIK